MKISGLGIQQYLEKNSKPEQLQNESTHKILNNSQLKYSIIIDNKLN